MKVDDLVSTLIQCCCVSWVIIILASIKSIYASKYSDERLMSLNRSTCLVYISVFPYYVSEPGNGRSCFNG